MSFDLKDYNYELPRDLIARKPAEPRDSSRLMVIDRKTKTIEHKKFTDIVNYVDERDLFVANNTQVLKARLVGSRILADGTLGGKIEMLLLEKLGVNTWEGAFHSSAKQVMGLRFQIKTPKGEIEGTLIHGADESPTGTVVAEFDIDPIEAGAGELPLPHYLERGPNTYDEQTYQTVYSKHLGSAAAPTAGLHFTPQVIEAIQKKGAQWSEVTLHVGLGTFRPVKAADIREHRMHDEKFWIDESVAKKINDHKANKGRIVAVGTTSVRSLESAWDAENQKIKSGRSSTEIFLYPGGRKIQVVDRLLTNFHLPQSTLLMLVCSFADRELILQAYQEAVQKHYRFYSYGDAMLIL